LLPEVEQAMSRDRAQAEAEFDAERPGKDGDD
jgi:hypothetical protein